MKKIVLSVLIAFMMVISINGTLLARDWDKYPAWVEITGASRIYAIGDVHGAFDELTATLGALKIANRTSPDSFRFRWTGGDSLLVFTGDFNDRGLHTKQVYDAVMDLQQQAEKAGGRIIVLMGNHEAMMLNGQVEEWAKTLTSHKKQHYQNTLDSFTRDGLDYNEAISEKGVYGSWIRNLPLFAVINGFMFVHGGLPSKPITKSDLAADFKDDITKGDFKIGTFMNMENVLWNRDWWMDDELVSRDLKVFGVMGVVFGHTIGALGTKGRIAVKDNRLVSIDVGMTPAYGNSKGGGLLISTSATDHMVFRAIYPDSPEELLFSIKMPAAAYPSDQRKLLQTR
ncbi:MAG: metallophosphoesterase [Candidatus Riflebacteria bacterium]|nr:metallophosphoesterase [Candidatus Riflebacteria bacterium]